MAPVPIWLRNAGRLRGSHAVRLARELLWLRRDPMRGRLGEWLQEFRPEAIFFCAGDSAFAYRIVEGISAAFSAPIATFLTDDYVLPRRRPTAFQEIRRRLVLSRMRRMVGASAELFVISPQMRAAYLELFGKDGVVLANTPPSMKQPSEAREPLDWRLIYAGALHSRRAEPLSLLADALNRLNADLLRTRPARLDVYTSTPLPDRARSRLLSSGVCRIHDVLAPPAYRDALNAADILVHVESFDRRALEATRLSLSTKIPEYLSLGKPILAIGPAEVSSVRYLAGAAQCVSDPGRIAAAVAELVTDEGLRARQSAAAEELYHANHSSEAQLPLFLERIERLSAGSLRPGGAAA